MTGPTAEWLLQNALKQSWPRVPDQKLGELGIRRGQELAIWKTTLPTFESLPLSSWRTRKCTFGGNPWMSEKPDLEASAYWTSDRICLETSDSELLVSWAALESPGDLWSIQRRSRANSQGWARIQEMRTFMIRLGDERYWTRWAASWLPAVISVGGEFWSLGINLDPSNDRWGPISPKAGIWTRYKMWRLARVQQQRKILWLKSGR